MTQITTSVPTSSFGTNTSNRRYHIHQMSDGYRVALYYNNGLKYSTSPNGASAWSAPVSIAGAGLDKFNCSLVAGSKLWFFQCAYSSTYGAYMTSAYYMTYNGSGSFGAFTQGIAATGSPGGLTSYNIRAVYDPLGTTTDTYHVAGTTGIIHLLTDNGASWAMQAFDVNTTVAGNAAHLVLSQSLAVRGAASGQAAMEMALRVGGSPAKLFALAASGSTGSTWLGYEITYTSQVVNGVTTNTYSLGSKESPNLPASVNGAALCLSDTTGNPGVDLAIVNGTTVQVANRSSAGIYSPSQTVASNAVSGYGAVISSNRTTGDEVIIYPSGTHLHMVKRTSGAWGADTQLDSSASSVQPIFSGVNPSNYGVEGPAVVYVNGASSPYALQYEDSGTAAAAAVPSAPTVSIVDDTGSNDAFGVLSAFTALTTTPQIAVGYNDTASNDRMGAVECMVYDSTAPLTAPGIATVGTPGTTTYTYWYTWVTTSGESIVSPPISITNGNATLSGTNYNALSAIAVGPADTTARKIYRQVSTGAVGLVHTISDNTTTTWNDQGNTAGATPPSASPTVWDSGQTTVTGPPLPGGVVQFGYGSIGTAATHSLLPNHNYSVQAYVWESVGGLKSSISSAITVYIQTAPTVTSITPTTITSVTPTITFTPNQAEGVSPTAYQIQWSNPTTGVVEADTGIIAASMTNGTPYSASGFSLARVITDNVTRTMTVTVTYAPANTNEPSFTGSGSISTAISIPICVAPSSVSASWKAGPTPLTGGSIDVTWMQAASTPSAVTNNIYQRISGTTTWELAGSFPATLGVSQTRSLYSLKDFQTYDIAVSAVDSNGFESALATFLNVAVTFSRGYWVNNADDPAECIELGLVREGDALHEWLVNDDKDYAIIADRTAPVLTFGTVWYLSSYQDVKFILDQGYEPAMMALLMKWSQESTPLQVRDPQGNLVFCCLSKAQPGFGDYSSIWGFTLNFKQVDASGYSLLAA